MTQMIQPIGFLKIAKQTQTHTNAPGRYCLDDYKPLLGLWLIDLVRVQRCIESLPRDDVAAKLLDTDFLALTGLGRALTPLLESELDDDALAELELDLQDEDDGPMPAVSMRRRGRSKSRYHDPHKNKAAVPQVLQRKLRQVLKERRASLYAELNANLAGKRLILLENVERLGRLVQLSDVEKSILSFAAAISCFAPFHNASILCNNRVSDDDLSLLLAALSGHSFEAVRKALRRDALLPTANLIDMDHDEEDLADKLSLNRNLCNFMLDQFASDEDLGRQMLSPATPGTLTLTQFPHLAEHAQLLLDYLAGVAQTQTAGANILLYGPPGTGKTEFAKALAKEAGLALYEIGHADGDDDPNDGEDRLQHLNFCQRALSNKPGVALLFDEIEDVLPGSSSGGGIFFLLTSVKSKANIGKAWVNRTLEANRVPTFWITNNEHIDPAYLRRFDYSLLLRIPPRTVRTRIVTEHLGSYAPNAEALAAIAELDDLMPAQLHAAARVARLSSVRTPEHAWERARMALQSSRALLGQTRSNLKPRLHTRYSLEYLHIDVPIEPLLTQLRSQSSASICLYGPSGTGKSQLARHIAEALGKTLVIKRASDLLDKYIGETEKRIADMFEEARAEDAVLLLDEADSFLSDRSNAIRNWELTQTNELLTQLECFEGIFFATTNLMDKLDQACLRRFGHKIRFDYLKPDQSWNMFVQEFDCLGGDPIEAETVKQQIRKLDHLTPGDFAVAVRNTTVSGAAITAAQFLELLKSEVAVKMQGRGRVGFV